MTGIVAAVAIGRNEGQRLVRCLEALRDQVSRLVYVDSGSTDGSVEAARSLGAEVIVLDDDTPFTAARARNAGFAALARGSDVEFVQFVDGDCEVQPGWIDRAVRFLRDHPDVAVVCGRRRERFADATIWNRLIDMEWDTPVGETRACGGDALFRVSALAGTGGFDPRLIAGEEPELCVRLRKAGWRVFRIEAEMTLHDAAMTRFGQWWRRTRRAGYAFAEGAAMHGAAPERHRVAETRRALLWGAGIPLAAVAGIALTPWSLLLLLLWPVQMLRLKARGRDGAQAFFLVLGRLPEAIGVLEYAVRRALGRRPHLIEYK